jgi:hypothetical protein
MYTKFLSQNLKGRDYLGYTTVDRKIILKWVLRKLDMRLWTGFMQLRIGPSGRLL